VGQAARLRVGMVGPWKSEEVGVVKTRIAGWVSRWRERRLVRVQTRQTSATRQAKRAADAGRSHPTGQGGSGGG
jgi:hypothetical protein